MAFCLDSLITATITVGGTILQFDIFDTPIGCLLPGSPDFHGFRYSISKTTVNLETSTGATTFFPADGLHGGPPNVGFVSDQRITVPIGSTFIRATLLVINQFDASEQTVQVFWPSATFPTTLGGCNYTATAPNAIPVTLAGSIGSGPGPLVFTVLTSPTHGVFSGVAPNLTYTPNSGFVGTDTFTFKVNDGANDSPTVSVNICVKNNSIADLPPAVGSPVNGCSEVFGPGASTV